MGSCGEHLLHSDSVQTSSQTAQITQSVCTLGHGQVKEDYTRKKAFGDGYQKQAGLLWNFELWPHEDKFWLAGNSTNFLPEEGALLRYLPIFFFSLKFLESTEPFWRGFLPHLHHGTGWLSSVLWFLFLLGSSISSWLKCASSLWEGKHRMSLTQPQKNVCFGLFCQQWAWSEWKRGVEEEVVHALLAQLLCSTYKLHDLGQIMLVSPTLHL